MDSRRSRAIHNQDGMVFESVFPQLRLVNLVEEALFTMYSALSHGRTHDKLLHSRWRSVINQDNTLHEKEHTESC
jgi:hypothetical protein